MNMLKPFDQIVSHGLEQMSPTEQRVAQFFRENRETVLIESATTLADHVGTSDATVVRTAKALGFDGLDHLRRTLAAEIRQNQSPAARLGRTLNEVGNDLQAVLGKTLAIHHDSLERLHRDILPTHFEGAVNRIVDARRVAIFGLGPSAPIADYFAFQLNRFGQDAFSLTDSGLVLADKLRALRSGDLVVILAYTRVYRELAALLKHAARCGLPTILLSDTLGPKLRRRVDLVIAVARGRTDMLSMHTATLAFIEALLVGIATKRPQETLASLKLLGKLRTEVVDTKRAGTLRNT